MVGLNLGLDLMRVTEAAALAAARFLGRGRKDEGDEAAVEAMRSALARVAIAGMVVIGEGEKDEAPMLFNGESVGSGEGPAMDVAVDPVDGTSLLAHGRPDSIAVIAAAPRGAMWFPGPAFYMDKLVVGRDAREAISPSNLGAPAGDTLAAIARAKGKAVGDVVGAILAATHGSGVDVLMGIGGTPEGVIAACAVRALGGAMLGRPSPQKPGEREAAIAAGLDLDRVLTERDLVASEDVFFAATGITDGVMLRGVRSTSDVATTESLVLHGATGSRRTIRCEHRRPAGR